MSGDREADLTEAYGAQAELLRQRVRVGDELRGYTVALGSKVVGESFGAGHPVFGRVTARMLTDGGTPVDLGAMAEPRVEPALAFVMDKPVKGPGVTVADAIAAVRFVLPALEITDQRVPGRAVADLVADNLSCGRVVLGADSARLNEVDVRLAGCVLYRNGEVVRTTAGGAVLGSPLHALVWLANTAGTMDMVVEPGQIVVVSSLTTAVDLRHGDSVATTFAGLGDVAVRAGALR